MVAASAFVPHVYIFHMVGVERAERNESANLHLSLKGDMSHPWKLAVPRVRKYIEVQFKKLAYGG